MRSPISRTLAVLGRVTLALLTVAWWVTLAAARGVRKVGSVIAELYRQQERINARLLSYDTQMTCPDVPPQTYGEFLLRTSGPLRHEPSARARLSGRPVR
jgi:hypothetical protein